MNIIHTILHSTVCALALVVALPANAYDLDFDIGSSRFFGKSPSTDANDEGGVEGTIGVSLEHFGNGNGHGDTEAQLTFGIFAKNTGSPATGGNLRGLGFYLPTELELTNVDGTVSGGILAKYTASGGIVHTWSVTAHYLAPTSDTVSNCLFRVGVTEVCGTEGTQGLLSGPFDQMNLLVEGGAGGNKVKVDFPGGEENPDFGFCVSDKSCTGGGNDDGILPGQAGAFLLQLAYEGSTNNGTKEEAQVVMNTFGADIENFAGVSGTFWCARWQETGPGGDQGQGGENSDVACGNSSSTPDNEIPEPSTASLFGGLALLTLLVQRRRRQGRVTVG